MRRVRLIAVIVCALAGLALEIAAAEPLKVFLFTSQVREGIVDEQLEARQESLRDVARALAGAKYQKTLTVVPRRDQADVIIELVSRGETTRSSSGSSSRSSGGGTASASQSASETKRHLTFRLSLGASSQDLTIEADLPWPKMAERAAEDLARWAAQR